MNLAYVMTENSGGTDKLLSTFAALCVTAEINVAGVVQSNLECIGTHHCDMDARVLPDGPVIRISQSLGKDARGCRLDPAALEQAVAEVKNRLSPQTELLIVNKFGKHEADGRGFRELIAEAIGMDVPVLVGVNQMNLGVFLEFAGDCALQLPSDSQSLMEWFDRQVKPAAVVE